MRIYVIVVFVFGSLTGIACKEDSRAYKIPRHELEFKADEPIIQGQAARLFYDRQVQVANEAGVSDLSGDLSFAYGDTCVIPRDSDVVAEISDNGFVLGRFSSVSLEMESDDPRCPTETLFLVREREFRPWVSNVRFHYAGYRNEFVGSGERQRANDPDPEQWNAIVKQFAPFISGE